MMAKFICEAGLLLCTRICKKNRFSHDAAYLNLPGEIEGKLDTDTASTFTSTSLTDSKDIQLSTSTESDLVSQWVDHEIRKIKRHMSSANNCGSNEREQRGDKSKKGIYMSCIIRKPVFRVSDQFVHKPACTTTEDG